MDWEIGSLRPSGAKGSVLNGDECESRVKRNLTLKLREEHKRHLQQGCARGLCGRGWVLCAPFLTTPQTPYDQEAHSGSGSNREPSTRVVPLSQAARTRPGLRRESVPGKMGTAAATCARRTMNLIHMRWGGVETAQSQGAPRLALSLEHSQVGIGSSSSPRDSI